MLTNLVKDRKRDQLPAVEDIGGCSLLIVSGAFQNGIKATSWDLDTNLKAMWQLLICGQEKMPVFMLIYVKLFIKVLSYTTDRKSRGNFKCH